MNSKFVHQSQTIPQLDIQIIDELINAGIDESVILNLCNSISTSSSEIDRIPSRLIIDFPATQPKPDYWTTEFIKRHWKEVVRRALLARLSANRTLRDLMCGFVRAFAERNVLIMCLSSRAAIESAVGYDRIAQQIGGRKERVEADILPFMKGERDPNRLESLYDPELVDALALFCHGMRIWPTDAVPNSVTSWQCWLTDSTYEPKNPKNKDNQSDAGQILDALKLNQRNILTDLDKAVGRHSNMHMKAVYALLSEFCHPNADNRNLGTQSATLNEDVASVEFIGDRKWTPRAIRGAGLSVLGLAGAIEIHSDAHNLIFDCIHELTCSL